MTSNVKRPRKGKQQAYPYTYLMVGLLEKQDEPFEWAVEEIKDALEEAEIHFKLDSENAILKTQKPLTDAVIVDITLCADVEVRFVKTKSRVAAGVRLQQM